MGLSVLAAKARAQPAAAERYEGRLFDGHLHLNWENGFRFPVDEAFALMRANGVTTIIATSCPNDGTHALVDGATQGVRVVPFLRPYRVRSDVQTWFSDATVLTLLEEEFKRGYYVGFCEFHLSGEAAASERGPGARSTSHADTTSGCMRTWDDAALELLFRHDPRAKIIWAHTGFSTPPREGRRLPACAPAARLRTLVPLRHHGRRWPA